MRRYLADHACAEMAFIAPDDVQFNVGVNRFTGTPEPLHPAQRMFTFVTTE